MALDLALELGGAGLGSMVLAIPGMRDKLLRSRHISVSTRFASRVLGRGACYARSKYATVRDNLPFPAIYFPFLSFIGSTGCSRPRLRLRSFRPNIISDFNLQ